MGSRWDKAGTLSRADLGAFAVAHSLDLLGVLKFLCWMGLKGQERNIGVLFRSD